MIPAPPSAKNIRAIKDLIRDCGFAQTLPKQGLPRYLPVPSGIKQLDSRLGGGLPRGAISEVTGMCSSGRTGLVLAALARSTQANEIAAYVDATDCLDQLSAQQAGVVLERLLWVRCGEAGSGRPRSKERGLVQPDGAWRAANLIVSAGGFGVVAVDLGGLEKRELGKWQRRPWMRLKHALEGSSTALIVLAEKHLTGSAADMVLELCRERTEWDGLLGGIGIRAEVVKDRAHGAGVMTGGRAS